MVPVRILLIEDSPTYRELATILLSSIGHTIFEAGNAEDGLRMAREKMPDLILMDINLPGMDGFKAVARFREDPLLRPIPVLGMTADRAGSELEQEKARQAGFDAYIEKPIDRDSFQAVIGRYSRPRNG